MGLTNAVRRPVRVAQVAILAALALFMMGVYEGGEGWSCGDGDDFASSVTR